MSSLQSILSLCNIEASSQHLVYTAIVPPDGSSCAALILPISIQPNQDQALARAKAIIKDTQCEDVFVSPMHQWLPIGGSIDPDESKTQALEAVRNYATAEADLRQANQAHRSTVDASIREEAEQINHGGTIEAYYHGWACAVQLQAHIKDLQSKLNHRLADQDRLELEHPEFVSTWESILRDRLAQRDESGQAEMIIQGAHELRQAPRL